MKSNNAIEVNNIAKSFRVYFDKGKTLKEKILFTSRRKFEKRMVLDGISFEVQKGEAVGLIGQNGCGKSTTLKLLTRIMYPDSGSINMSGRVSSLIELGAGFHPDMSGRQNIYINASIFGLTRKEIDIRLKDIIAFSELEEFIDNPVRTYSSGMYMRLAFSVAINVDADILLIDEILAVGDANFQAKCFKKMLDLKKKGVTIILVSHDLQSIEKICDRSIWIDNGRIKEDGFPTYVNGQYIKYMTEKSGSSFKVDISEKSLMIQKGQHPLATSEDIVNIYSDLLERIPSNEELMYYINKNTVEQVLCKTYFSDEYRLKNKIRPDNTDLCKIILCLCGQDNEQLKEKITDRGITSEQLIKEILNNEKFAEIVRETKIVNYNDVLNAYRTILGRSPAPNELNYYLSQKFNRRNFFEIVFDSNEAQEFRNNQANTTIS